MIYSDKGRKQGVLKGRTAQHLGNKAAFGPQMHWYVPACAHLPVRNCSPVSVGLTCVLRTSLDFGGWCCCNQCTDRHEVKLVVAGSQNWVFKQSPCFLHEMDG